MESAPASTITENSLAPEEKRRYNTNMNEQYPFEEDMEQTGPKKRDGKRTLLFCALALVLAGGIVGAYAVRGAGLLPHDVYALSAETQAPQVTPAMASPSPLPQASPSPTPSPLAEEAYVPTAVVVDGAPVGVLASRQAAEELLKEVILFFEAKILQPGALDSQFQNQVTLADASTLEDAGGENMTYDALFAALTGEDTPILVETTVTERNVEIVPRETITEKDSTLLVGTCMVATYGADGETHTVTVIHYENGKAVDKGETTTVVVSEKEDALIRVGSQKVDPGAEPNKRQGQKGPSKGELTFIRPMDHGEITVNYGQLKGIMHLGLDFKAAEGDEVLASAGGTVVCVMERGGYGLMLEIDHGNGFVTRYTHLQSAAVALGDAVTQGQVIAAAGQSGNCKGPVLHFELRVDGIAYNPRYYLD